MNLLVHAPLCEPPTESLPFRYVFSCAKIDCSANVLLECEQGTEEMYFGAVELLSGVIPQGKDVGTEAHAGRV